VIGTAARRLVVIATLGALGLLLPGSAAAAGGLSCVEPDGRPFLQWLDIAQYGLVDNGHLERTDGWTLTGGAKLVAGNEPYFVHSRGDSRSLSLPRGSSATTPWTCMGVLDPTLRFFAVNSGSPLSLLAVEALLRDATGRQRALPIAALPGLPWWLPTLPLPVLQNVTGLLQLDGLTTEVAFRFTPTSGLLWAGAWRIDDVYVDPWRLDG
jgi:hypothetical protein